MIASTPPKLKSPQEYLALEVQSEQRHEYRAGEVFLMTGGTPNHNDLSSNLLVALKLALKGKPYRTFIADQRLAIPEFNLYTYPDVMVLPKPIALLEGRTDTVLNPCFIAEVLSKSTRDYDHGDKFAAYRTIPNFQEYLLVDHRSYALTERAKNGQKIETSTTSPHAPSQQAHHRQMQLYSVLTVSISRTQIHQLCSAGDNPGKRESR